MDRFDDFVTPVSTSTGNLINCFQTEQGDDYDQRNGLAIIAKSIHCNGLVQRMDSTNIVRIMVVQFESSADNSIANFLQYPNADATYLYRPVYSIKCRKLREPVSEQLHFLSCVRILLCLRRRTHTREVLRMTISSQLYQHQQVT